MRQNETPPRQNQVSKPFGANRKCPNVVHEDRHVQPLEPPRDPLKVDPSPARILQEIFHLLNLSRPLRLGALDFLDDALELLLVPSVQDEVESLVVELLSGGFSYAIGRAGDNSVRRWALEVLLPVVGGSEEVEPDEIDYGSQLCENRDETEVVDGVGQDECSAEERCVVNILVFQWRLNTERVCGPLEVRSSGRRPTGQ